MAEFDLSIQGTSTSASSPAAAVASSTTAESNPSAASNSPPSWHSIKLWEPAEVPPRGGASVIDVDGSIVVFGGTDREQSHFNDISVLANGVWKKKSAIGDVPTPRSGHAVATYGRFMFLFGGIDFAEEADYNDLFVFNLDTLRWCYVGEAGAEVRGRNSHSMAIATEGDVSVLVVYGGASCAEGPLDDTHYAVIPKDGSLGNKDAFVTWHKLEGANPGPREMHATASIGNSMYISGGRSLEGKLLNDVWKLTVAKNAEGAALPTLTWTNISSTASLPEGRCAHGMVAMSNSSLCIYGGFFGGGISGDVFSLDLTPADSAARRRWQRVNLPSAIPARFGHCMCATGGKSLTAFKDGSYLTNKSKASKLDTYVPPFMRNAAPAPAPAAAASAAQGDSAPVVNQNDYGFVVFGGVSAEEDYGDMWICYFA